MQAGPGPPTAACASSVRTSAWLTLRATLSMSPAASAVLYAAPATRLSSGWAGTMCAFSACVCDR